MRHLLEVDHLRVSFFTHIGEIQAVRGVSFDLAAGETIAIVGESGCGKTVTAQSLMRLVAEPPGRVTGGEIRLDGKNLILCSENELTKIRGQEISMIFQDPMTALNPTMTIGRQMAEGLQLHQGLSLAQARIRAVESLTAVGLPHPEKRLDQYPHQFSGGMRQRVMIAMAMACQPKILIADEPTTALDVTIQAQILELMEKVQQDTGVAIILITHDLGVVAGLAQRILVMYAGKIVESGTVQDVFYRARHPYTWGLLKSVPRLDDLKKTRLLAIPGQPPDLFKPPAGCAFASRCPRAMVICQQQEPPSWEAAPGHQSACWLEHPQASIGQRGSAE